MPNNEDDLVLETDASNEHWSAVLKIKDGEKLCRYSSGSFNKAECNYPTMQKEILAVMKGISKFLIFLAPKHFLVRTDCKGILGFVKKNLSNMEAQGRLLRWQLWLNQFSFTVEHIQGSKNSLADSLTRELANGITIESEASDSCWQKTERKTTLCTGDENPECREEFHH